MIHWKSKYLIDLEVEKIEEVKKNYKDINPEEFEYRVVWLMLLSLFLREKKDKDKRMKVIRFSHYLPEFLECIPDKQFRMLPLIVTDERYKDNYQSVLLVIDFENDRRNRIATDRYTKQFLYLTWALVVIGIGTIFVTLLPIITCR